MVNKISIKDWTIVTGHPEIYDLFQKCHLEFKHVNFENNDILFYLFFYLNHHLPYKYWYSNALNYFLHPICEFSKNCCAGCMTFFS
jgi:hypothetical protein